MSNKKYGVLDYEAFRKNNMRRTKVELIERLASANEIIAKMEARLNAARCLLHANQGTFDASMLDLAERLESTDRKPPSYVIGWVSDGEHAMRYMTVLMDYETACRASGILNANRIGIMHYVIQVDHA